MAYKYIPDIAAAIVSVMLSATFVVHAWIGQSLPPEMGPVLGAATTWLFIRSAQVGTNGHKEVS